LGRRDWCWAEERRPPPAQPRCSKCCRGQH
jgi:hypothetical protein